MSQEVILVDRFRYTKLINILKDNKIKVIFPSVLLSATLVLSGCATNEVEVTDTNNEQSIEETVTNEESNNVAGAITNITDKASEADTVVEGAISGTIELAKSVAGATDEYRQTEEYQQDVEQLKAEFDALVNFILGRAEYNGYKISDVGSDVVDYAKEAVSYIDGVIESYIPDYKDKAKEKLSELGSFAWDKGTDAGAWLLNKGEEFASEVKEKSKEL